MSLLPFRSEFLNKWILGPRERAYPGIISNAVSVCEKRKDKKREKKLGRLLENFILAPLEQRVYRLRSGIQEELQHNAPVDGERYS